ncbi:MAG: hypothetical protein ACOX1S_09255 [Anaerostipes sp.]|jgi:hypothetical protein|nr:hypothetical protein [Anaerostipes sp.]
MKKSIVCLMVGVMVLLMGTSVSAASLKKKADVRIRNSKTGEVLKLKKENIKVTKWKNHVKRTKEDGDIEYEFKIDLPEKFSETKKIGGKSNVIDKTVTKKSVVVRGKFNYLTKPKGDVKITSCSGSWKPKGAGMYMTKRLVVLYGGSGQVMKKKPSKNSFSYTTNWGYKPYVPQSSISGTGLILTATAKISGMTAKADIDVRISGGDILDNF